MIHDITQMENVTMHSQWDGEYKRIILMLIITVYVKIFIQSFSQIGTTVKEEMGYIQRYLQYIQYIYICSNHSSKM